MDYVLSFSISISQQVHAHISVSSLPACPRKKKFPSEWFEELAEQNRAKKKKKIPVKLESMKLEFYWEKQSKTEECSRTKQSKTKKNFPVELESMKLEFHWEKQSNALKLNRAKQKKKN